MLSPTAGGLFSFVSIIESVVEKSKMLFGSHTTPPTLSACAEPTAQIAPSAATSFFQLFMNASTRDSVPTPWCGIPRRSLGPGKSHHLVPPSLEHHPCQFA